jgi:hypothetical protein
MSIISMIRVLRNVKDIRGDLLTQLAPLFDVIRNANLSTLCLIILSGDLYMLKLCTLSLRKPFNITYFVMPKQSYQRKRNFCVITKIALGHIKKIVG